MQSTAKACDDTWSVPGQSFAVPGGGIQYFLHRTQKDCLVQDQATKAPQKFASLQEAQAQRAKLLPQNPEEAVKVKRKKTEFSSQKSYA